MSQTLHSVRVSKQWMWWSRPLSLRWGTRHVQPLLRKSAKVARWTVGPDKHEMLRYLVRRFRMVRLNLDVPDRPNAISKEFGGDRGGCSIWHGGVNDGKINAREECVEGYHSFAGKTCGVNEGVRSMTGKKPKRVLATPDVRLRLITKKHCQGEGACYLDYWFLANHGISC